MADEMIEEFIGQSILRIEENTARIARCLQNLKEEDIWRRPNDVSNSIANIILHVCGNMRQYVVSGLSGASDVRERDKEFSIRSGLTKSNLLEVLEATTSESIAIIKKADRQSLMTARSVQCYRLSGIGIIVHITEHYSYHTGQIIFWTKEMLNIDMGFYALIDLNQKNKT